MKVVVACTLALVGFAANSLLCRAALGAGEIDPASFTLIRLLSGAVALAVLTRRGSNGGSWISAGALFAYAAAFSFAYVRLTTGTGALILFAVVQATVIGTAVVRGERLSAVEWLGFLVALSGLVALTAPGLTAPDPLGATLMGAAGVAWGIYTLRGRGASNPLAETAGNFLRTLIFAPLLAAAFLVAQTRVGLRGCLLAAASGALASGIGYSFWYAALPHMPATRAAILQLSVPLMAGVGGIVILGESVSPRLVAAAAAIVGGLALTIVFRRRTMAKQAPSK